MDIGVQCAAHTGVVVNPRLFHLKKTVGMESLSVLEYEEFVQVVSLVPGVDAIGSKARRRCGFALQEALSTYSGVNKAKESLDMDYFCREDVSEKSSCPEK